MSILSIQSGQRIIPYTVRSFTVCFCPELEQPEYRHCKYIISVDIGSEGEKSKSVSISLTESEVIRVLAKALQLKISGFVDSATVPAIKDAK